MVDSKLAMIAAVAQKMNERSPGSSGDVSSKLFPAELAIPVG